MGPHKSIGLYNHNKHVHSYEVMLNRTKAFDIDEYEDWIMDNECFDFSGYFNDRMVDIVDLKREKWIIENDFVVI